MAQGRTILDPTLKNWPQYAGLGLLVMLCGLVAASRWRKRLGLPYHVWRFVHTKAPHVAVAILAVHVLYGCDTFRYPPPRNWLFISIGAYALLLAWVKTGWRLASRRFSTIDVMPTGTDALAVTFRAVDGKPFSFAPGQFVFIRLKSNAVPAETHPFTISSSPASLPALELTIRSSGDWTGRVHRLSPGDPARINGPYGLFGSIDLMEAHGIVMIAGGIGITPMLSILGALAEKEDPRPVILVWSNRTRAHQAHPERIDGFEKRLKNLQVHHVFTRETDGHSPGKRLDTPGLGKLLSGCNRRSKVLVCGPPAMMTSVGKSLRGLGFRRQNILMERFDL
jgi:3-phenylpropionate/trans-cinnamate dioxygenase ferredoxin reductase subunit